MHFGVNELSLSEPVKKNKRIARASRIFFQQRDADGHFQLPGKPLEGTDKAAAGRNSLSLPLLRGSPVNIVSVAPHLGEQSDIRPHLLCFPTGTDSLFQILFQAAAGRYLQ